MLFWSMFTLVCSRLEAFRAFRATRRELSQLSDRDLADFGISRASIDNVARGINPVSRW